MAKRKVTVLPIDTDAYCGLETGVCAVPAAQANASAGAPDGPAPADGSSSIGVSHGIARSTGRTAMTHALEVAA